MGIFGVVDGGALKLEATSIPAKEVGGDFFAYHVFADGRPGAKYTEERVPIRPGDSLLLASDGIVEAMNVADELCGFPRLEAVFREVGAAEPTAITVAILAQTC